MSRPDLPFAPPAASHGDVTVVTRPGDTGRNGILVSFPCHPVCHDRRPMSDSAGRRLPRRPPSVAAWVGSENLGDELVFRALCRQLDDPRHGARWHCRWIPDETSAAHGVAAVRRRRALVVRGTGATVLGGGGLLQDQTSTLNLDLHLTPVVAARLRREVVVGVGLGAGPLSTRGRSAPGACGARRRARSAVRRRGVRRPPGSARPRSPHRRRRPGALPPVSESGAGRPHRRVSPPVVGPPPPHPRPAATSRRRRPVRRRRRPQALDDLVARHRAPDPPGRLRATEGRPAQPSHRGGHGPLPRRWRRRASTRCVDEVAASRLVVSMRYHGGMAAVLAGRPVVLIGYDPKVDSLAADIGPGAAGRRFDASRTGRPRSPRPKRARPGGRRRGGPPPPSRTGEGQRCRARPTGRAARHLSRPLGRPQAAD